jgi:hypothetical protein
MLIKPSFGYMQLITCSQALPQGNGSRSYNECIQYLRSSYSDILVISIFEMLAANQPTAFDM